MLRIGVTYGFGFGGFGFGGFELLGLIFMKFDSENILRSTTPKQSCTKSFRKAG